MAPTGATHKGTQAEERRAGVAGAKGGAHGCGEKAGWEGSVGRLYRALLANLRTSEFIF